MWSIRNLTPYKVGRTWGRDKEGVHEWIVAVKGTYDIQANGAVSLADEQIEPLLAPEFNGEPGASSLRYDADLVAAKPTTDVLLNGTAYAPSGRPSSDFMVELRAGPISKTLRVRGHRTWFESPLGLRALPAEPVLSVPVTYERAYGGSDLRHPDPRRQRIDLRNPVGCGVVSDAACRLGQPLPNFEYPRGQIDEDGPAGFGALDHHWSPRREFAGTYDKVWKEKRFPLLPSNWDPRSLLSSPFDQRPEKHLVGGEVVELINLSPSGKLSFMLPKVFLRFRTRFDGRTEEHRARLATVIVEPDHARLMMVWQSSLAIRTNVDYLDYTIVSVKPML